MTNEKRLPAGDVLRRLRARWHGLAMNSRNDARDRARRKGREAYAPTESTAARGYQIKWRGQFTRGNAFAHEAP